MKKGKLILFCGPSGSGKTTITRHLLDIFPQLSFSVSATTRAMRANEVHGKDYYFLTVEDFQNKIIAGEFVEWEEVYKNVYYGTLKSEVERIWNENKVVAFDVDVEGGLNIKKIYGENLLAVFVKPLSIDVLRKRLTERNTESPETLETRIGKAEHELAYAAKFDHVIVNDTLKHSFFMAEELVGNFLGIQKEPLEFRSMGSTGHYNRVIIIDDNEIDLEVEKIIIKEIKLAKTIDLRTSAEGVIEELSNIKRLDEIPELIFLDLNMPGMNGFEFLNAFNELPDFIKKQCRIVIITSNNDQRYIDLAYTNPNVIDYVLKPLDSEKSRRFLSYDPKYANKDSSDYYKQKK